MIPLHSERCFLFAYLCDVEVHLFCDVEIHLFCDVEVHLFI